VTPARFAAVFQTVERLIEDRWGIPVRLRDVPHPFTGDLDGAEIHVDFELDAEDALFVLVHLFGHTVQWNTSEEYRQLGLDAKPGKTEDELKVIYEYEKNATRYSLQLMHDAGVRDLDKWASDFWYADWLYLEHFFRTGEKLHFPTLRQRAAGELLEPLAIPEFKPTKWVSRWSF
jgi:hypothetical protein